MSTVGRKNVLFFGRQQKEFRTWCLVSFGCQGIEILKKTLRSRKETYLRSAGLTSGRAFSWFVEEAAKEARLCVSLVSLVSIFEEIALCCRL